jgi:hypothetical protein
MVPFALELKADTQTASYYVFTVAQDGIEPKELEKKAEELKARFDQILREANERQENLSSMEIYIKLMSEYSFKVNELC